MVPIAALILTDDRGDASSGVDLAERAALVAHQAGINHTYFTGRRQPDLAMLHRLRARGVFGEDLLGWPRLFAGLPPAWQVVVLDARAAVEPQQLAAMLRDAAATSQLATLAVDIGPERKNSLIRVVDGAIASVMGDGNASNLGVAIIPSALMPRIRGVHSLQDAVHRLAKAGRLRAYQQASPAAHTDAMSRLQRMAAVVKAFFGERLAVNAVN